FQRAISTEIKKPYQPKKEQHSIIAAEEEAPLSVFARNKPLIISHDDPAPVISETQEKAVIPPPPCNRFSREFLQDITAAASELEAAAVAAMQPEDGQIPVHKKTKVWVEPPFPEPESEPEIVAETAAESVLPISRKEREALVEEQRVGLQAQQQAAAIEYKLPPIELIAKGKKTRNPQMNQMINDSIAVLESTLESFGVKATVTQVMAGPAVTRYELQPAPGVKVARITSLSDDIALSLAAQGVRIEAPIPGKSAIGIEVARKDIDTVYFRDIIESDEFKNSKAKLSFALGKNISGESIIGDLAKMPHLLIAGATGSGKSICINSIICSILYKAKPNEVKMLLIDPKKVEMTNYNSLPHLLAPVVSDNKKAANALKWVVNEMENRYSLFVGASVKDFQGYNKVNQDTPLPQIVVIIDELADLMMVARHDVEEAICRIAQMARAAGIHLVVATQRPSVDVITGLIKANIPSRIAFAVSSYTDSRTILDMGG
ncbi:MAG: DNA translocase FtsK, partial [Clostridiales bacterium]